MAVMPPIPNKLRVSPTQMSTAIPFMKPLITVFGTNWMKRPRRSTLARMRMAPVSMITMLMKRSGSTPGWLASRSLPIAVTSRTVTAVMGAVGPEHCTRVPPKAAVINAMTPADKMPARAPRRWQHQRRRPS